jgi:hypothetical protein
VNLLAKNFGVPESAFANVPSDYEHDRYRSTSQMRRVASSFDKP